MPCPKQSNEYFGGLLDAQLSVTVTKTTPPALRVMLACDDERVFREMHTILTPARETIIRKPGKRDSCVALLTNGEAVKALEFASAHCLMKKQMAAAALAFIQGTATLDAFVAAHAASADDSSPSIDDDDVSAPWISGFFDVRGLVVAAAADKVTIDDDDTPQDSNKSAAAAEETETDDGGKKKRRRVTKRRGAIKIVLPKSEKYVIPMIQKVVGGKVKRSSPCRIVFDSKDHLAKFIEVLGDHVRVKRSDLAEITAAA